MGHRNLLGHATEEYWQVLHQHFSIARPDDCTDCIPISVFGDEVEVFDGLQYACVNWSSDVALHHSDAMISKFLCVMIPTTAYYFRGKTNLTLQEAMKVIVRSLNRLYHQGPLRLVVCALKGDWKWMANFECKKWPFFEFYLLQMCCNKELGCPLDGLSSNCGLEELTIAR